ncbi:helix-turn-helix domain-containing protein [Roseicitreum antarcticum]|uniref:DNA-binding transcriptional regulator, XRE-family HTH domain n=1 Tax=Roseicitreum antarcticum TaxID=564137 RepID=A0A1H2WA36_9RHOB|nr:helix-turn-helix transcriptional regulator [Roseicitreum antarcticum]SDW77563.1 DNA-binding transcriptional regulator, XRE-family HTH domain [Roseicitreum antarcticum]
MEMIPNNVGRLRDLRGLNQTQLAELVGTTQPHISRIERGDPGIPVLKFAHIAKALNVSISDLFSPERTKQEEILLGAFRRLPAARQMGWIDMAKAIQVEKNEAE